jgi:fructokinase
MIEMTAAGSPVVGIGEILWDLLPDGPRLGGAPCNVLVHLASLGHRAAYITAVGQDSLGAAAREELEALGLDTSFVVSSPLPTGRAEVEIDADGVPRFSLVPGSAYEAIDLSTDDVTSIVERQPRALVFGTLAQCSDTVRRSTRRLATALPDALRLYDVNLREGLWNRDLIVELAGLASVIKLNRDEAATIAPFFDIAWPDTERFCRSLADRLGIRAVAVTAGGAGASLLLDGVFVEARAPAVVVVDTIGSGDAFGAALVDGILAGAPASAIIRRSISLGALIATKPGGTPAWDAAELAAIEALPLYGA